MVTPMLLRTTPDTTAMTIAAAMPIHKDFMGRLPLSKSMAGMYDIGRGIQTGLPLDRPMPGRYARLSLGITGIHGMSDEQGKNPDNASTAFIEHLEATGFFEQIKNLETNLKTIAGDLASLGQTATQRLEETESLAAHVLAVESILAVMLKANPVTEDQVRAAVTETTADLSGNSEGSPAVQQIVDDILKRSGG